ncbi:unnamed protein product [Ranitomeya imitator]|uniref:Reverse transcriptase domain-containing protein n=1 Tax=Ranitomeya imitator TaxID=111125 RepID=A0ABN9M9M8_9NEOB|nr:unnamed protein product [Ranitomeya imitator]
MHCDLCNALLRPERARSVSKCFLDPGANRRQRHLTTASGRAAGYDVIADPRHMIGVGDASGSANIFRSALQFAHIIIAVPDDTLMSKRILLEDLKKIPTGLQHDNLTRQQRRALTELRSIDRVLIKPADKGGNIVLWPTEMYEKEAFRQLRDEDTYRRLSFNPTSIFQVELLDIIEEAFTDGLITKDLRDGLVPDAPRTPCLYLLPKVHKNLTCPTGRPIVSGNGGLTENVGKILDFYLKPIVETLPSYLRDTGDILSKISNINLEPDMLLVTLDVESLYTSIRHAEGMEAVSFFLSNTDIDDQFCRFLLSLLEFALSHNFFIFKKALYLQLQGTAMGAAFAPSYACLFLGLWERKIFITDATPLSSNILMWARYIDDVFAIWQGTEKDLLKFIDELNVNDFNIKLTCHYSRERVDFLDVCIQRDGDGFLQSDLHRKTTSVNSLLHSTSAHPKHLKNSIPYGQLLRAKRICSEDSLYQKQAEDISHRFMDRGYSSRTIRRCRRRASRVDRASLFGTKRESQTPTEVRFIATFSNKSREFKEILGKYWPIIKQDSVLTKCLTNIPSVTYRRNKNLRDLLTHSHYRGPESKCAFGSKGPRWGFFPCRNCTACKNLERCFTCLSSDGSKEFRITQHITCSTDHVVYYATCPCGLIYVGLTSRQLRIRIREHIRDIKAALNSSADEFLKPIPRHFKEKHGCNSHLLKVRGIDRVLMDGRGGDVRKRLAQLEAQWIVRIDCIRPKGLNEVLSFVPFL